MLLNRICCSNYECLFLSLSARMSAYLLSACVCVHVTGYSCVQMYLTKLEAFISTERAEREYSTMALANLSPYPPQLQM